MSGRVSFSRWERDGDDKSDGATAYIRLDGDEVGQLEAQKGRPSVLSDEWKIYVYSVTIDKDEARGFDLVLRSFWVRDYDGDKAKARAAARAFAVWTIEGAVMAKALGDKFGPEAVALWTRYRELQDLSRGVSAEEWSRRYPDEAVELDRLYDALDAYDLGGQR